MTAREKLKVDHPDWTEKDIDRVVDEDCPYHYGYLPELKECTSAMSCAECWDREIPETTEKESNNMATTKKTKAQLIEEIVDLKKELDKLEKYKKYEDFANEFAAVRDSFINAGFTRAEAMRIMFKSMEVARHE